VDRLHEVDVVARPGNLVLSYTPSVAVPPRGTRPASASKMFRIRRYRVFLIFSIIAIGALYHFTSLGAFESAGAASVEGLKNFGQKVESSVPPPATKPDVKDDPEPKDLNPPIAKASLVDSESAIQSQVESKGATQSQAPAIVKKPEVDATETQTAKATIKDEDAVNPKATPAEKHAPAAESVSKPSNKTSKPDTGPADPIIDGGGGRLEIIAETGIPKIHWSQMPEHFPVPTENLIQLPTGKPKAIPKIQHEFAAESAEAKTAREEKRDMIKKTFMFSWNGYKKKAWLQDELSPVSGKFRNPFCAWGATLVDSLDTLFMMGLKDEFEEAVEAVKEIDFTTSPRNDIPLFETVIRYLGGLVAAYDISDGAHRILLDKAVELADILMGAFDTPNRMPMTFYLWKPTFASQPHRAKTRVVLAELGSLSVEFTRLAQITKEAKYYDAIARITNEFEDWQNNTRMPGLWPMKVDASGCKKPDVSPQTVYDHSAMNGAGNSKPLGIHDNEVAQSPRVPNGETSKNVFDDGLNKGVPSHDQNGEIIKDPSQKPAGVPADPSIQTAEAPSKAALAGAPAAAPEDAPAKNSKGALGKRDIDDGNGSAFHATASNTPECEAQGLASPPYTSSEEFGIGGQADSTYEYLPKEYMLLGGLEDKYRSIYEMSADVITKDLLYRTMIPDEKRRILHPGLVRISDRAEGLDFRPEGSHLGCFAGGMYAVGAKIFGREGDMKIAKELTDGCVWAYEATITGIMPDGYLALQCPDPVNCPWNETLYHEKLDPFGHLREQNRLAQQQSLLEANKENTIKGSEGTAPQADPSQVVQTSEKLDIQPGEAESIETGNLSAQPKVEQAPQQSPEVKTVASDPLGANNNMIKSPDGAPGEPAPLPEQSAEHPASLPVGGATAEQPVSPPSGGGAAPIKPRAKRQLGDIDNTPAAADSAMSVKDTVAVPATGSNSRLAANKTISEQSPAKQDGDVPLLKQPNGTSDALHPAPQAPAYTPPPLPTHEEFVKAKIKDERLPPGMTKVTGSRYLLR